MKYERTQGAYDKQREVFRVIGICFENGTPDEEVEAIVAEVLSMETLAPGLMTAKALYRYMKCLDEYVLERMLTMPVGSSFIYTDKKITRWSERTYNAENMSV